jgi:hypothetical protein
MVAYDGTLSSEPAWGNPMATTITISIELGAKGSEAVSILLNDKQLKTFNIPGRGAAQEIILEALDEIADGHL